jgi:hypothetical protein
LIEPAENLEQEHYQIDEICSREKKSKESEQIIGEHYQQ